MIPQMKMFYPFIHILFLDDFTSKLPVRTDTIYNCCELTLTYKIIPRGLKRAVIISSLKTDVLIWSGVIECEVLIMGVIYN